MQFFTISAFVSLLTSYFIDLLALKIILILLFGFSFSGINNIALSMSLKQNPKYSGSITSIIAGYAFSGAVIFQYTTGYLAENYSINGVIYISIAAMFLIIVFSNILNFHNRRVKKAS